MKCFVVFVLLSITIGLSEQAVTKEQRLESLMKMLKNCATKEGATEMDLNEVMTRKPTTTKAGKCLRACMAESIGFIKDKKLDLVKLDMITKMSFETNADKIKMINDLGNECASVTDDDRCEAAHKILECGDAAAKSKDLSFEDLH